MANHQVNEVGYVIKPVSLTKNSKDSATVNDNDKNLQNDVMVFQKKEDSVEGSETSLLNCVKSLLSGEVGHSLMIVTKDGIHKEVSFERINTNSRTENLSSQKSNENVPVSNLHVKTNRNNHDRMPISSSKYDNIEVVPLREKPFEVESETEVSSNQVGSTDPDVLVRHLDNRIEDYDKDKEEVSVCNLKSKQEKIYSENEISKNLSTECEKSFTADLLSIAKKMIEKKALPLSSNVKEMDKSPASSSNIDKKSVQGSDSIITMYLSSPGELKEKLEKLKTNSPVIVLQAGEDPTENSSHKSDVPAKSEEEITKTITQLESDAGDNDDRVTFTSVSSNPVVYRCVECDYSSHNKHYYKQHVDLVHNADRPYKCPHCDYAGKRRHALLEHMVVHSNQRPFSCEHCNASFRKKVFIFFYKVHCISLS